MPERRYEDEEVREILSLATTGDSPEQTLHTESTGLTLVELQRIGEEAGIEPARIAQAARQLDLRAQPAPIKRMFGLPIGMTRVVDLPRAPSDREWEQLIGEFRSTFGAQGVSTTHGGLRQWSQGNLHISVEPTASGHQLRLTTRKEDAVALYGLSVMTGGFAALMGITVTLAGKPEKAIAVVTMLGGIALAAFVANMIRLPGWARERSQQLQDVSEHAVKLLSKSP